MLEDNPLKAKARKGRDINTLSAEMRQMEEQCVFFFFCPGSFVSATFDVDIDIRSSSVVAAFWTVHVAFLMVVNSTN